jgi:hypothetical protein
MSRQVTVTLGSTDFAQHQIERRQNGPTSTIFRIRVMVPAACSMILNLLSGIQPGIVIL